MVSVCNSTCLCYCCWKAARVEKMSARPRRVLNLWTWDWFELRI